MFHFSKSNYCEVSFQKLKATLTTAPELTLSMGRGVLMEYGETSRVGLPCALVQNNREFAYASRQLKDHKKELIDSCYLRRWFLYLRK